MAVNMKKDKIRTNELKMSEGRQQRIRRCFSEV